MSVDEPPPYDVLILYNLLEDDDSSPSDPEVDNTSVTRMRRSLAELGHRVVAQGVANDVAAVIRDYDPDKYIVFNWCEGLLDDPNAYEVIPPVLEEYGFTYTGARAWSLAATQNKAVAKECLLKHDVSTPASRVFEHPELDGWDCFPAFVKPAREHCSYGIERESIVDTPAELKQRIEHVLETYECPALVEDFIDGAEFNVSVWGNGALKVLPLSVMDFSMFDDYHDRLCSYDAKWAPESDIFHFAAVKCPAPVPSQIQARIEEAAKAAYTALEMRDYGRVDIRLRDDQPYVLDLNPNPDITMESGFCRSARIAGFDYGRAIAQILAFASERHTRFGRPRRPNRAGP